MHLQAHRCRVNGMYAVNCIVAAAVHLLPRHAGQMTLINAKTGKLWGHCIITALAYW